MLWVTIFTKLFLDFQVLYILSLRMPLCNQLTKFPLPLSPRPHLCLCSPGYCGPCSVDQVTKTHTRLVGLAYSLGVVCSDEAVTMAKKTAL